MRTISICAALVSAFSFGIGATSTALAVPIVDFESTLGYTLVGDGAGTATRVTTQSLSPTHSAQLSLPDGSVDFAKVIIDGNFGTLGNFVGNFSAYVPSTNARSDLFPYMYVGIDTDKNGSFTFGTDSFVIVFDPSGPHPHDVWYQDIMDLSDIIHVVGARPGLAAGDFSSSNGGGLLSSLDATSTGSGLWGDLDVLQVRVGAGEWPDGGAYTAFVDDIGVGTAAVPEPATLALFGAGLAGLSAMRRRRKTREA